LTDTSLHISIWNKTVYVDDDVSLCDDSCLCFIMSKSYSIFNIKIHTKIKKAKTNNIPN